MNSQEIAAYNLGVRAALDAARRSAVALTASPLMRLKPTRVVFAADALDEFAEAGEALLISGRNGPQTGNGSDPLPMQPGGPKNPPVSPAATAKAREAYVARIPAGDDGNFGLTDEEIMRPSRETIINWLSGRTPMLASHWSRIAANLLKRDGERTRSAVAAE